MNEDTPPQGGIHRVFGSPSRLWLKFDGSGLSVWDHLSLRFVLEAGFL